MAKNKNWKSEYDAEARAHSEAKDHIRQLERLVEQAKAEARIVSGANAIKALHDAASEFTSGFVSEFTTAIEAAAGKLPHTDDLTLTLDTLRSENAELAEAERVASVEYKKAVEALRLVTDERDRLLAKVARYERSGVLGLAEALKIVGLLPKDWQTRSTNDLFGYMSKYQPKKFKDFVAAMWSFYRQGMLSINDWNAIKETPCSDCPCADEAGAPCEGQTGVRECLADDPILEEEEGNEGE